MQRYKQFPNYQIFLRKNFIKTRKKFILLIYINRLNHLHLIILYYKEQKLSSPHTINSHTLSVTIPYTHKTCEKLNFAKYLPFYPNTLEMPINKGIEAGYMFANMYPTCTLSPLAYISIPLLDIYATLFTPVSPTPHSSICLGGIPISPMSYRRL